jgi:hypothetical protein
MTPFADEWLTYQQAGDRLGARPALSATRANAYWL